MPTLMLIHMRRYVRVSLAGCSGTTHTIQASLNPIWYEPLTIRCSLPGILDLAPKISIAVYDSDEPLLGISALNGVRLLHGRAHQRASGASA